MNRMTLFQALCVVCAKTIVIVHTELSGSIIDGFIESKEISREEIASKDTYKFKDDKRGKMPVVSIKPIDSETIEIFYTSEE